MLHRAESLKEVSDLELILSLFYWSILQFMDTFVYKMGLAEKEHSKHAKIDALQLSSEEWDRVHLFLNLLSVSLSLLKD